MHAAVAGSRLRPGDAVVYIVTAVVVIALVVTLVVTLTSRTGRRSAGSGGGDDGRRFIEHARAPANTLALVYAPWCSHCKQLVPVFERLQKRGFQVELVDGTTKGQGWLAANNITAYPTVCILNDQSVQKLYPSSGERSEQALLAFYSQEGLPSPPLDQALPGSSAL